MEKEWMKLIDDVENDRSYSSEPHFKFIDFIREKSTICLLYTSDAADD